MKALARLIVITVCAGLAACSDPPPPAEAATATTQQRSTPQEITRDNQGVLTDTQATAINRANQVSNLLEDAEAERRRQIEAQAR